MSGRRLRIALPWLRSARLEGEAGSGRRLPATEWLLTRATRQGLIGDWRDWLLDGASLGPTPLARFPEGPCARAAAGDTRPDGTWSRAAPVHLVAALDHLRLAAPAPLPLEASESRQLVADLNEQLAGRGFRLEETPAGWLCECPGDLDCTSPAPEEALGLNLRDTLPRGRDAARVMAWVNESQMVLHGHPVNERRAARGLPPVNSVWLWGFGTLGHPHARPQDVLLTDDEWLAGLWRLHGAQPLEPDRLEAVVAGDATLCRIGLTRMPGGGTLPGALGELEQRLSAPLRAALASRSVAEVALVCGRTAWQLDRDTRWRVWRRSRPLAELLP